MEEPTYANYVRSTRCDANGRFTFDSLPDGSWFLIVRAKSVGGKANDVVIMRRVEAFGGGVENVKVR